MGLLEGGPVVEGGCVVEGLLLKGTLGSQSLLFVFVSHHYKVKSQPPSPQAPIMLCCLATDSKHGDKPTMS